MRTLRTSLVGLLVAASGALCGCAASTSNVLGRDVTLVPKPATEPRAKGELLAVEEGRIWLRTKEGRVREFEAGALREVLVQRHDLGGGRALRIGLIGGAVSAAALTVSCGSVSGNGASSCALVGAAIGGLFALTGALSSVALDSSAQQHVSPDDLALRAYARFPGGWPKGVRPDQLTAGPRPPERLRPRPAPAAAPDPRAW
ncbi:MAG TPA: hypothetical protein VMX54_10970 [Vicinamibacteria bacterium]|nr:hypothetical protein [Vicinamibacteria bacterium]